MPTGAEGCAKLSRSNLVTAMFLSNVDPTYFIYKMCGHWTRSFDEVWKFKALKRSQVYPKNYGKAICALHQKWKDLW